MAIGHQLGLRLFLEGVEIPVIGASVTATANTPVTAAIQVIATDRVLDLLPRTVVHLFFYDFVDAGSSAQTANKKKASAKAANISSGTSITAEQRTALDATMERLELDPDVINSQYKLLFMGEVQGLAFQKDTGARSVTLNCVDFSNYWDTTYQYNFKGSLLGGRRHAAFIGANANFFTGPLGKGVGTIAALLNGRSVNFPELKGLLAGIVRVLEAIGGAYYGETTFRGANDFTSIAELRLKILQQITAAEKDTSTAKLFARKTFNMWMNRQSGSLGKLVTFRGLTRIMQQFIYHDVYPCPSPKYQPKITGLKKNKAYAINIARDPRTRQIWIDANKMEKLVRAAKKNLRESLTTANQPAVQQFWSDAARDLIEADKLFRKMVVVPGANLAPIRKRLGEVGGLLSKVNNLIGWGGRTFYLNTGKLGNSRNVAEAANRLDTMGVTLRTLLEQNLKKTRELTYDKLDRVNSQVLRPDIWFAPAPRCNVLFPELYGQFSWSRNFLREVSRMELQTTHEILGDDALFNGRYYAPNVEGMRRGLRLSSRKFGRLILPHELLTGIIPMFEKLSEANLFAMRSKKVKFKGAKVSYAQRAVNFQYFKHRFASRSMSASGRFNPWFVPGFPAVLIDRPMTLGDLALSGLPIADQLKRLDIVPKKGTEITRASLLQLLVPVQYVGSCMQMAHSVNQTGGMTQYLFGQARVHRESSEFLGVDRPTISKKVGDSTRTTIVAAILLREGGGTDIYAGTAGAKKNIATVVPRKGGRGPLGGRVISTPKDVTKQYVGQRRKTFGTKDTGKVLIGQEFEYAGDKYVVKAYSVKERFVRRLRTKIDLPIEDAVRPPWIWDGWTNLKIGETYMQLFGTNAVTDVDGVTSAEALTGLVGQDELEAALETKEGYIYGSGRKSNQKSTSIIDREISQSKTGDSKANKSEFGPGANRKNKKDDDDSSADAKLDAATILAIEKERTIENCIDYLVRVYSFIQANSLDAGNFIRNYCWRPVATMPEILGSVNFDIQPKTKLQFTGSSSLNIGLEEVTVDGEYAITGTEGFHSRAFGDTADLFGLVDPKVKKVLGLDKEKRHTAAKRLDVRARRRNAVLEYSAELAASRGLLG